MNNIETVVVETDLLILGGGMASCGAAVEAAHWAKKNGLKVTLVDKAAMDRSGAVAMGLSAINQYVGLKDGENTVKNYVDYVRNDLMGVTREDLVANIARHVDSSVHLFEKWGLPIWKAPCSIPSPNQTACPHCGRKVVHSHAGLHNRSGRN
jgi:adenylylsulfate reductase subunit A